MKKESLKVMTVRLDEKVAKDLEIHLKDLGLRRDEYLRNQLGVAIGQLALIAQNTEFAATYINSRRQRQNRPRIKIGLKLPEKLIGRINDVCAEKRVPRDLFIEEFFRFLAYGWPEEGVTSPMAMAADYLRDPYRNVSDSLNLYEQRCALTEKEAKVLQELESLLDDSLDNKVTGG